MGFSIIVLFILGLCSLFPKSISVTGKSEIARPRTFVFGVLIMLVAVLGQLVLLPYIAKVSISNGSDQGPLMFILLIIIPIILALVLKQPKTSSAVSTSAKKFNIVNVIGWIILAVLLIGAVIILYGTLIRK